MDWEEGYRHRLVRSLPQLIEKIRIFEDDRDDRIVEALKVKNPSEHLDRRLMMREDEWLWVDAEILDVLQHRLMATDPEALPQTLRFSLDRAPVTISEAQPRKGRHREVVRCHW